MTRTPKELASILLMVGNPSDAQVDAARTDLAKVDEVAAHRHAAWHHSNQADWTQWLAVPGNTPATGFPPENPLTEQLMIAYEKRLRELAGIPEHP